MSRSLALIALLAVPKPVDYHSTELGFSASFPDSPVVGHASQKLGGEVQIPVDTVGVDRSTSETYLVTVTSYPPEFAAKLDPAATLKAAEEAAVTGSQAKLLKDNEVGLSGHPAREFWARAEGGELHARLVMAKERMFMVLAITPASKATDGDKFLQSFAVDRKP